MQFLLISSAAISFVFNSMCVTCDHDLFLKKYKNLSVSYCRQSNLFSPDQHHSLSHYPSKRFSINFMKIITSIFENMQKTWMAKWQRQEKKRNTVTKFCKAKYLDAVGKNLSNIIKNYLLGLIF